MALSGEQWLQTHFFPVVESLPAADTPTAEGSTSPLAAISAMRLMGALDALVATGVLTAEQQARCRAALEPKGVTTKEFAVQSFGVVTALIATEDAKVVSRRAPHEPDRLVRVVADGAAFGLVDGEPAVLTCLEVWQRHVRAGFLVATSPSLEGERMARSRELQEWLTKRQAGDTTIGDRPPMPSGLGHPGTTVTWLLAAGGSTTEGVVSSGHGGGDWWRLEVTWDVAVSADGADVQVSATEGGRVVGRASLRW